MKQHGNICIVWQATDDNMAYAHCVLYTYRLQTHTQKLRKTHNVCIVKLVQPVTT
jgi:hypothetical protein